ncbi:MAG: ABC-2 type transport system ATP-binding protein [Phenylobacterium sp.]|jgi:ABC-2 type transport system ATP-binding protein
MGLNITKLTSADRKGFQLNIEDLDIKPGEAVSLIGANGSGKTTLLESILGLTNTAERQLTLAGFAVDVFDSHPNCKKNIGVQLQNSQFNQAMTVSELVQMHHLLFEKQSLDIYNALKIDELRKTRYSRLSRGQRQRIDIYLALAHEPDFIFLDEPGTGLDAQMHKSLVALLLSMKSKGATILMASHTASEISICEKILWLAAGTVKAFAPCQSVINKVLGKYKLQLICHENHLFDEVLTLIRACTGIKAVDKHQDNLSGSIYLESNVLDRVIAKFGVEQFAKISLSECEINDLIAFQSMEDNHIV